MNGPALGWGALATAGIIGMTSIASYQGKNNTNARTTISEPRIASGAESNYFSKFESKNLERIADGSTYRASTNKRILGPDGINVEYTNSKGNITTTCEIKETTWAEDANRSPKEIFREWLGTDRYAGFKLVKVKTIDNGTSRIINESDIRGAGTKQQQLKVQDTFYHAGDTCLDAMDAHLREYR